MLFNHAIGFRDLDCPWETVRTLELPFPRIHFILTILRDFLSTFAKPPILVPLKFQEVEKKGLQAIVYLVVKMDRSPYAQAYSLESYQN